MAKTKKPARKCPKCKRLCPLEARLCQCGFSFRQGRKVRVAKVTEEEQPQEESIKVSVPVETSKNCPKCTTPAPARAPFCWKCGYDYNPKPVEEKPTERRAEEPKRDCFFNNTPIPWTEGSWKTTVINDKNSPVTVEEFETHCKKVGAESGRGDCPGNWRDWVREVKIKVKADGVLDQYEIWFVDYESVKDKKKCRELRASEEATWAVWTGKPRRKINDEEE